MTDKKAFFFRVKNSLSHKSVWLTYLGKFVSLLKGITGFILYGFFTHSVVESELRQRKKLLDIWRKVYIILYHPHCSVVTWFLLWTVLNMILYYINLAHFWICSLFHTLKVSSSIFLSRPCLLVGPNYINAPQKMKAFGSYIFIKNTCYFSYFNISFIYFSIKVSLIVSNINESYPVFQVRCPWKQIWTSVALR